MPDHFDDDVYFDRNGALTERLLVGGQATVVHYDDLPEKDITVVRGIRCTTALRTVIDIAADLDPDDLRLAIESCLERRLFTVEEAKTRLLEPDIRGRPGAELLGHLLPD